MATAGIPNQEYTDRLEKFICSIFQSDDLENWMKWVRKYNGFARQQFPLPNITGSLPRVRGASQIRFEKFVSELHIACVAVDPSDPSPEVFYEGNFTIEQVKEQLNGLSVKLKHLCNRGVVYGIQAGKIYNRMKQVLTKNASGGQQLHQAAIQIANLMVQHLRTYIAPLLFILTTCGAVFVLYCVSKAHSQLKGSHVILCAITAADFFTVFFSLLIEDFLADGLKNFLPSLSMPHHIHNWACKIWSFFWILSNSLSSNLLCLMAADRVYALSWPLHHRASMTKSRYRIAVGAFVTVFAIVSVHGILLYEAYEYYGSNYCYVILTVSPTVGLAVQLYTNLVMNGFLPGTFLAASNLFIFWRIWRIRSSPVRYGVTDQPSKGQVRTSLTLIILAAVYLITSVPRAAIYFIMFLLNNELIDPPDKSVDLLPLIFSLAKCLNYFFYINCSLNWAIYCARVPLFKKQLPSCVSGTASSDTGSSG